MHKFLQAKHWQLFFLMFGLPLIFDMIIFANAFRSMADGNASAIFDMLKFFPLIMILYIGLIFG